MYAKVRELDCTAAGGTGQREESPVPVDVTEFALDLASFPESEAK